MSIDDFAPAGSKNQSYLLDLVKKIRDNKVVLFVGAGLSRNAVNKDRLSNKKIPLWKDLTREMLIRIYGQNYEKLETEKYNYEYVADKFKSQFDRNEIYNFLVGVLEDPEYLPGDIHRLICQFDWEIVTTNFDTIIERAFESVRCDCNVIYTDADLTIKGHPRIYKINGCIKNARDEIILTGDDFRTFSQKKPLMELYIKKCFIESTVLFVGFSLDDPAFNMIHGWVRDHLQDKNAQRIAYSIHNNVDEVTKNVWHSRGIRFIELFPAGNVDRRLTEQRLNALFRYLQEEKFNNQKEKNASTGNKKDAEKIKQSLREGLTRFGQEYRDDGKIKDRDEQTELKNDLIKLFEKVPVYDFFEFCYEDIESDKGGSGTTGEKIIDCFIHLVNTHLIAKSREAVLYYLLKEMIGRLDQKEIFENEKIAAGLHRVIEKLMIENPSDEMNNPNLWVIAMYIELWLFHHQKHPDLEFFKKGFSILDKTAMAGGIDQKVSMDLHHYWLTALLLIGPFKYAKNMLKICRKNTLQEFDWDIPNNIHFHMEVFFCNRLKHLDLFLTNVNRISMKNRREAFYKFLLLDNFLKEYKQELNFSDLFIDNSYQTLAGMFRGEVYEYRNTLAEIHYPMESGYFQKILHIFFQELLKGRSLLFMDISAIILSFSTFEMTETEMNTIRKTSLGELILLVMIYDIPIGDRKKQENLKRFMAFMIEKKLIDVSYFVNLLLFRLEGISPEDMEQETDNGISRYFNGLVSYISSALPYLEDDDLKSIKDMIQSCLPGIKSNSIREAFARVVGYLSSQLPGIDFSTIYKNIFSLAERDAFASPIFEFLTLTPKDAEVLKFTRLRLILEKNLENPGTSFDRDFISFLLKHQRRDIIPPDETIEKHLDSYFKRIFMDTPQLIPQQLMDLQRFIEMGYIPLEESIEERIKNFFKHTSGDHTFYFEWKLFAEKMIPVYKTFCRLIEPPLMGQIMDGFLKNPIGKEMPLKNLEEKQANGFAHQLKKIHECPVHRELKDKAIAHVKNLVKEGFYGGGYLAAFWEVLDDEEKKRLSKTMLSLWIPPEEKTIIKAIQAAAEFLKYTTDKTTMDELSNLVTYTALYNSPPLKIETLKLFTLHADQNTGWFQEHRERILNLLPYLMKEKDLSLLRELIHFLRCLKPGQIKETIGYLKENAPYAEIRRAFSLENFKKKQSQK